MEQQQVLQLLWFALYFLVGMGLFATRLTATGDPDVWSPAGMLRRLRQDAESNRDLDEGLSTYPAIMALGIAVMWVVLVLAWPLLLMRWAWTAVMRRSSAE